MISITGLLVTTGLGVVMNLIWQCVEEYEEECDLVHNAFSTTHIRTSVSVTSDGPKEVGEAYYEVEDFRGKIITRLPLEFESNSNSGKTVTTIYLEVPDKYKNPTGYITIRWKTSPNTVSSEFTPLTQKGKGVVYYPFAS